MANSTHRAVLSTIATVGAHLIGVVVVGIVIGLLVLDWNPAVFLAGRLVTIPEIRAASVDELILYTALSTCVWALIVIAAKLVQLHVSEAKSARRAVKLSRGTVVTEALIVLPVFLLLTFGLAQLAVSGLAGILMNVAGYEAGRAAWVWQPEEEAGDKRMGVTDGIAAEKCKIAIALVMTPVAPGNFISDPRLNGSGFEFGEKMRLAAAASHVPFGGAIQDALGDEFSGLLAAAGSIDPTIATRDNQSVARALDLDPFIVRTLKKFTHAYHASSCSIDENHSATATYLLHIAMPTMGPLFGDRYAPNTDLASIISDGGFGDVDGVGLRWGYYSTYTRDFGFAKQKMLPNAAMPDNSSSESRPDSDGDAEGQIGGAVGL